MAQNMENMDRSVPATYHSVDYSRSLGKSYIFMTTLVLSIVGWITSLISQAFVTARISNVTVGPLWFGIILQLGVIFGLVVTFTNDTLFQYGIPLAILAALATSFGAQGVHLNVFSSTPSQKALAAGWLITCIVDVIWVLILSSEPTSYVYRYVASNGHVRSQVLPMNGAIQNVSTNLDAFAEKYNTGSPLPEPQRNTFAGSATGSAAGNEENRRSHARSNNNSAAGGDPESHRRRSLGGWSSPRQSHIGAGSLRDVPPIPEGAPTLGASEVGAAAAATVTASGSRPTSGSNADPRGTESTNRTTTDLTPTGPLQQPLPKALALFPYNASAADPYELTFNKGEVLEVLDKSGKWWEAIKSDGTKGIAPSNYLKMM